PTTSCSHGAGDHGLDGATTSNSSADLGTRGEGQTHRCGAGGTKGNRVMKAEVRLLILAAQMRFESAEHLVEKVGGFSGGSNSRIEIDERGQRTLRWNVVIRKNRLDAARRAHAG